MSGAYSEFFSGRGHQSSSLFQRIFFPTELILSNLSTKATLRRSGGMLPRKLTLSSTPMMHFVRTVSIMRAKGDSGILL